MPNRFLWWLVSSDAIDFYGFFVIAIILLYFLRLPGNRARKSIDIFFSEMEHQTISTINRCYFIVCLTEVLICSTHALTFNHRKYCRFDKTMLDPRHKIQGMSSISWNRCVRVCAIEPEAAIKSNDSPFASEANPKYPHTTQNPNCRKISKAMCFLFVCCGRSLVALFVHPDKTPRICEYVGRFSVLWVVRREHNVSQTNCSFAPCPFPSVLNETCTHIYSTFYESSNPTRFTGIPFESIFWVCSARELARIARYIVGNPCDWRK